MTAKLPPLDSGLVAPRTAGELRQLIVPPVNLSQEIPDPEPGDRFFLTRVSLRLGASQAADSSTRDALRLWRESSGDVQTQSWDIPGLRGLYWAMLDPNRGLRFCSLLEAWGRRSGNRLAMGAAQYRRAATQLGIGHARAALEEIEKARFNLRESRSAQAMCRMLEGSAWRQVGDLEAAGLCIRRAVDHAAHANEPLLLAACRINQGNLELSRGRLREAATAYRVASELSIRFDDSIRAHLSELGLLASYVYRGIAFDTEELDRLEARLGDGCPLRHRVMSHEYRGDLKMLEGDHLAAARHYRTALQLAHRLRSSLLIAELHWKLAEFNLFLGRVTRAELHVGRAKSQGFDGVEASDAHALKRISMTARHADCPETLSAALDAHLKSVSAKGFNHEALLTCIAGIRFCRDSDSWLVRARVLAELCDAELLLTRALDSGTTDPDPVSGDVLVQSGFVTRNRVLIRQSRELAMIAPTDIPVLIRGESGTGKELIAQLVHRLSERAGGPFEAVNCAAIPGELMESQLFGHRRGSFTGASEDKPGLFSLASGGTLFLDEIGEMSPALQAKLLRVLESGEIRPVGSSRREFVDVRIVAATNVDMQKAIAEGSFRKDLYYRLAGMEFHLPPLRDRREDILPLAEEFIRQVNDTETAPRLSREAVTWLLGHPWEGNVRELKLTIRRAMAVCRGGEILPEHLGGDSGFRPAQGLLQEMEAIERVRIRSALEASDFSMTQAAKILGLSRTTLYGKIERLGIEIPRKQ